MRTDLDHLPPRKQREIQHVVEVVFEVFEASMTTAAAAWRKKGRINKIILYGSHARGNWVWEPHTKKGYRSDYDLLIIVNSKRIVDDTRFGYELDQRFISELLEKQISAPVSAVVHTKQEVNNALAQGRYFFMDVAKDGIAVYQEDDKPLRKPIPQTPESALATAKEYYNDWYPNAAEFYESFEFSRGRGRHRNAVFQLHQTVEQLYHAVLLVRTLYAPHVHNIGFLRNLAEKLDRRLVHVWPMDTRKQIGMFNKLKEAYVKARYSSHYWINLDELDWLGEQVQELSRVVRIVCEERIISLQEDVMKGRSLPVGQKRGATALCRE